MTPTGWRLARSAPTTSQLLTLGLLSAVGARTKPELIEIYEALVGDGDPLQDERLIEMVARTAYEDMRAPHEWNWPNEDEHIRSGYIGTARAVLALFRGERA